MTDQTKSLKTIFGPAGLVLLLALAVRVVYLLATDHLLDGEENIRLLFALQWPAQHYPMLGPLHLALLHPLLVWTHRPLLVGPWLSLIFSLGTCGLGMRLAYLLFRREATAAWFAGFLLAVQWPLVQYATLTKVEPIFTFFFFLTLVFLAAAPRRLAHLAGAGLALTLACALRFEVWALIPLLALEAWREAPAGGGRWRGALLFASTASIFPLVWMLGHWLAAGDPLFSFHLIGEQGLTWSFAVWRQAFIEALTWPVLALALLGMIVGRPWRLTFLLLIFLALVVGSVSAIGLPPDDLKYFIAPLSLAMLPAAKGAAFLLRLLPRRWQGPTAVLLLAVVLAGNAAAVRPQLERQQTPAGLTDLENRLVELGATAWTVEGAGEFEKYLGLLQLRLYTRHPLPPPQMHRRGDLFRIIRPDREAADCPAGELAAQVPPWSVCRIEQSAP